MADRLDDSGISENGKDQETPRTQDLITLYEKDLKSSLRLLQRLDQLSASGGLKLPWFDAGVDATNELYRMLKADNGVAGCYDTVLGIYAARFNIRPANQRQQDAYLLELKKMTVETGIMAILNAMKS